MKLSEKKKTYKIAFSNLSIGNHKFEFNINEDFIKQYDKNLTEKASIDFVINVDKQQSFIDLQFEGNGIIQVVCHKCSYNFDLPIVIKENIKVKFSDQDIEDTTEIRYLPTRAIEIDLSDDLFDFIALSVPMQTIHPENEDGSLSCNIENLQILEKYAQSEKKDTSSNWDKLKELLDNNKN